MTILKQKQCDMGQMCLDCQPRSANGECPDQQPLPRAVYEKGKLKLLKPTECRMDSFPIYTEPPKPQWQEIDCPCCGDLARAFPSAQARQWIGLTDEQKNGILEEHRRKDNSIIPTLEELIKVVEALLKEKNR